MPEHLVSKKVYFGVFATLIVLTLITIEVALIDLIGNKTRSGNSS